MKRFTVLTIVLGCLLLSAVALAGTPYAKSARHPAKQYLVMVPHTAAECVAALDDFKGSKSLDRFEFGCKSGDHTAYCMLAATSPDEALAFVPASERPHAKAVELHRFTAAELVKIHEMMARK
jgi:hypothetical protein